MVQYESSLLLHAPLRRHRRSATWLRRLITKTQEVLLIVGPVVFNFDPEFNVYGAAELLF